MTADKRSTACLWKFSSTESFTIILTCRLRSKVKQTFEHPKLQQWFLFDVLLSVCYEYIGVSNRNWPAFSLRFQNWVWHKVRTTGKCLNVGPFISFQLLNTQKTQNCMNSFQQNTQRPILLEWQTNSNTYQWVSNIPITKYSCSLELGRLDIFYFIRYSWYSSLMLPATSNTQNTCICSPSESILHN